MHLIGTILLEFSARLPATATDRARGASTTVVAAAGRLCHLEKVAAANLNGRGERAKFVDTGGAIFEITYPRPLDRCCESVSKSARHDPRRHRRRHSGAGRDREPRVCHRPDLAPRPSATCCRRRMRRPWSRSTTAARSAATPSSCSIAARRWRVSTRSPSIRDCQRQRDRHRAAGGGGSDRAPACRRLDAPGGARRRRRRAGLLPGARLPQVRLAAALLRGRRGGGADGEVAGAAA